MPARQDQTLQIFLIISIFFSLVCAVLGFLAWRAYSEESQRYAALENRNRSKQTQVEQSHGGERRLSRNDWIRCQR